VKSSEDAMLSAMTGVILAPRMHLLETLFNAEKEIYRKERKKKKTWQ
jgi:hypothetical protein